MRAFQPDADGIFGRRAVVAQGQNRRNQLPGHFFVIHVPDSVSDRGLIARSDFQRQLHDGAVLTGPRANKALAADLFQCGQHRIATGGDNSFSSFHYLYSFPVALSLSGMRPMISNPAIFAIWRSRGTMSPILSSRAASFWYSSRQMLRMAAVGVGSA